MTNRHGRAATPGWIARRRATAFTLLETVMVLVIVGLLLIGIVKGHELLTSARVRGIVLQQDGIKTAYYGFIDRFRLPPGDFPNAAAAIPGIGSACGVAGNGNGNGNGRIELADGEAILAWEHLSKSGFLTGIYTCTANTAIVQGSVPRNAYGQFLQLVYDSNYAGAARAHHNLKTGSGLPSDLLLEIDRKVDDGNASSGTFRGSTYTTGAATDAGCWDAVSGAWAAAPAAANCGGATLH